MRAPSRSPTEADGSSPPLVRRVDHVYARVEDPQALFTTLTERLRLPRSYGFARAPILHGGAVSIGELVFLEALRYAPEHHTSPPATPGLDGLALESALPLSDAATELSARGLAHSPPYTYRGDPRRFGFGEPLQRAGLRDTPGPLWSMVVIGGVLGERRLARLRRLLPSRGDSRAARAAGAIAGRLMSSDRFGGLAMARSIGRHPTVWLHEFHAADMRAARAASADQLRACGGGALGLERVSEIVLSARDVTGERDRWERLLAPCRADDDGVWRLSVGAALRLVEGDADGIQALVCDVRSLERAAAFLAREHMLGESWRDGVRISPAALEGVQIWLRESPAVGVQ